MTADGMGRAALRAVLRPRPIECDDVEFGELARAILAEGYTIRFQARGSSMHPLVRDGDVLEVRGVPLTEIRVGEVVLLQHEGGKVVVHRVLRRVRRGTHVSFLVKGDRAGQADGWIDERLVLGKLVVRERGGMRVDLARARWRVIGRFAAVFSPLYAWLSPLVRVVRRLAALLSETGR